MVVNEKMNNSEKIITGIVSKKEFDSNLSSVSKIAEVSKMGGKSVLFRKEGNKLIMCAGGIKTSVAMVAIDIESDNRDECKGFIDGSALVKQFAGLKAAKEDKLEISFNLSKSCIGVRNSKGKTVVAFDVIKHVESAKNAEDTIAKYRNEMVERTYRLVRDVQTLGKVQLRCKDFLYWTGSNQLFI